MGISPTPWIAVHDGSYVKIVDANGDTISDLRPIRRSGDLLPIGGNNAHLMAAAPALAAALERILGLQDEHDGEPFEVPMLHAEQIARDVLASI